MTKQTKGRIRHVALSVADPWETAEFYKDALGLEEVTELDGALAEGVFLTDGMVNLAILKFKTDEASQGTGEMYWPVAANLTRITIAAGGSLLALDQFGWGVSGLYACVALGIIAFSVLLAFSTTRRAWTGA